MFYVKAEGEVKDSKVISLLTIIWKFFFPRNITSLMSGSDAGSEVDRITNVSSPSTVTWFKRDKMRGVTAYREDRICWPANFTPVSKMSGHILLSLSNQMQRYTIFFIAVNAPHVSGGFSAHHHCCYRQLGWGGTGANSPTLAVAASKLDAHKMLCVHFELLMMGGKPHETCTALTATKNIV